MAVLVRRDGPIKQKKTAGGTGGSSLVPRIGEIIPSNASSTSLRLLHLDPGRLMAGDFIHFDSLKGCQTVVLTDEVWRGFLGEVVKKVLRQPLL